MEDKKKKISRRDVVKGLATVPVAGAMIYGWYRKQRYDKLFKEAIQVGAMALAFIFELLEVPLASKDLP